MLVDDGVQLAPTKQNILNSFNTLVDKATNEQFSELWLSYSGHGTYMTDLDGDETDNRDEVICPVDYSTAGIITDDYIYNNFVCKLPQTTTLFSLMDCCHSGTMFDLPCLYTTSFVVNNSNNKHVANIISISGCRDDQTSADAYVNNDYTGAMTWSFLNALANSNYNIKLINLVDNMRILLKNNYTQVPLLAVSSADYYDQTFIGSVSTAPDTTAPNTASTPIPIIIKTIKFKIMVDYWYSESSWNVWSFTDNKYIFPIFKTFTAQYQIVEITHDLLPGQYKLCVTDAYGDGGVTSLVTDGLITLVSSKMSAGKLGEYTFIV
jgi:hypothetical protein